MLTANGSPTTESDMMLDVNGNYIQDNGLAGSTLNTSGLILRVGTAGDVTSPSAGGEYSFAATHPGSVGTTNGAPTAGNGRVNARITNNQFEGNFGNDFVVDPFVSTTNPAGTTGTWDATTFNISSMTFDPLARLNLVFTGNTGNGIDVNNNSFDAVYSNADDFKSRTTGATPAGPFGANTRQRSAIRLAGAGNPPPAPLPPPFNPGESMVYPELSAQTTLRVEAGFDLSGTGQAFDGGNNFNGPGTQWSTVVAGTFNNATSFPNVDSPTFVTASVSLPSNPSSTAVNPITITFTEYVLDSTVDITDFRLLRGSSPITGATNASPVVITSPGHGLVDGQQVFIRGAKGNTAANGAFFVDELTPNTFSLYSDLALTTPVSRQRRVHRRRYLESRGAARKCSRRPTDRHVGPGLGRSQQSRPTGVGRSISPSRPRRLGITSSRCCQWEQPRPSKTTS